MKKILFAFSLGFLLLNPSAVSAEQIFNDVYSSDPATTTLRYLVDKKILQGYADGTFRPLNLINRAEFTKMVVAGISNKKPDIRKNKNCFSDVRIEWFAKYVCYAKKHGWIQGYADGSFRPGDNITRAEAVKIIAEALEWASPASDAYSKFFDNGDQNEWYWRYLMAVEERGLFDELDQYISPHELISRKQMAELLFRTLKYETGEIFDAEKLNSQNAAYQEILATDIKPVYPPDVKFPHNSQKGWPFGCYAFAAKNLLSFKYGKKLDIAEVQKQIGWDGSFIWNEAEFEKFAEKYDIDVIFTYNGSAEFFFKKLKIGEPLIIYIPYYQAGENIGHQLVVYSFDKDGVWAADSLGGGVNRHIGYSEVFSDNPAYLLNITELRLVKTGGKRKPQQPIF